MDGWTRTKVEVEEPEEVTRVAGNEGMIPMHGLSGVTVFMELECLVCIY